MHRRARQVLRDPQERSRNRTHRPTRCATPRGAAPPQQEEEQERAAGKRRGRRRQRRPRRLPRAAAGRARRCAWARPRTGALAAARRASWRLSLWAERVAAELFWSVVQVGFFLLVVVSLSVQSLLSMRGTAKARAFDCALVREMGFRDERGFEGGKRGRGRGFLRGREGGGGGRERGERRPLFPHHVAAQRSANPHPMPETVALHQSRPDAHDWV
jgi:hypothetical protein